MIRIDHMTFHYKRKKLFNELNLEVENGSIYGLLGKNGAGKTTLLKTICGLIFAQQGGISIDGHNPAQRDPEFLSKVFFIPEDFTLPRQSGKTYLELYAPMYPKFDRDAFDEYARELEIDPAACPNLMSLSFGQRKKFLIAFGLATNTPLLILDEPTNGLDIPSKRIFRNVLDKARSEHRSIIVSTHQVKDLEQVIDAMIILDNGKILVNCHARDVLAQMSVEMMPSTDGRNDIVYAEQVPGGYTALVRKPAAPGAIVDLELLFNAALVSTEQIQSIVTK
jgi:ABC-2 type transport system ATP-binding protein